MSDVKFVRIRGRIVPIRKKHEASALKVAGVGSALATGYAFGKVLRSAEDLSKKTFDFISEKSDELPRNVRTPAMGLVKAKKRLKMARMFRSAGTILSGALLAQGIKKKMQNEGFETDSLEVSIGAEAGSQLAASIIAKSASKGFGIKSSFQLPKSVKVLAFSLLKKRLKI